MKTTVSIYDFRDTFKRSDTYKDNFSYEGLSALYDYLIELEESTGEEMDFDMVSICCEYAEYSDAIEAASEYFEFEGMKFNKDGDEMETREDVEKKALEFLQDRTQVIEMDNGGIIIQQF